MNGLESEDKLGEAILEYLEEHPGAADTIVGIADWWLTRHQVRVAVQMLQGVLDRLTEKGVLETVGEGEQLCYRRKRD
ncbi:MAG TPA: hypothetical protein VE422_45860 [Terriglobia bacterium]|nr:hypothetical protein [Terriglobia bacterium]